MVVLTIDENETASIRRVRDRLANVSDEKLPMILKKLLPRLIDRWKISTENS